MPLTTWFISKFAKVSGGVIKGGVETAKTATEIPKNLIETEKARLEVAALKRDDAARKSLIVPATFEDVQKYDRKYKELERLSSGESFEESHYPLNPSGPTSLTLVIVVVAAALFIGIIFLLHSFRTV